MASDKDDMNATLDKDHALGQLNMMQKTVDYKLIALSQRSLLKIAARRIPWLSNFLQSVDDTGDAIVKIGDRISSLQDSLQETPGSQTIGHAFHFGSVAMAAFDFVRIPIIYLAAYILNEKVPLTLDNNARWAYSGLLLTLSIIALTVPAAATVIGFVGAGIGLSVGVFLLGKTLYERYQLGKKNREIKKIIKIEEDEMRLIQQEAKDLEERLSKATEEDEIIKIYQKITILRERYDAQHATLEILKNRELHIEQKMAQVGIMQVVDKGLGVCLSSLTIIGLSLSLFFPMVGLGILTGVAVAGGVYLVARLTAPVVMLLGNWLISKAKSVFGSYVTSESLANENILTDTKEKQQASSLGLNAEAVKNDTVVADKEECLPDPKKSIAEHRHDSTAGALAGLKKENAAVDKSFSVDEPSAEEKEKDAKRVSHLFTKPTPNGRKEVKEEDDREINTEQESP